MSPATDLVSAVERPRRRSPDHSRLLVALGGNALLRRGQRLEADLQRANIERAVAALQPLLSNNDVVLTHGNGPQVGLLALQAANYREVNPYPLDVLGAESEGMIGYLLEQRLRSAVPGRPMATLLTQVIVDANDPAFLKPSKPVGPTYADEAEARNAAAGLSWKVARDGDYFRRVVASPEPQAIVELETIRLLVNHGVVVICAGGGGIPVVADKAGALHGVEAVIDKDLSAALLAANLGARFLLMLTDVAAVQRNWGTSRAQDISHATPEELRALDFASGSMGPKIEAACRFVDQTGGIAAIGALDRAEAIVRGEAGTQIARAA